MPTTQRRKPRPSPARSRTPRRGHGRTIAIGDIHGCSQALRRLLREIRPRTCDTIVCLGDYVGKGLDSEGVLETLIGLMSRCHVVPLLGNHDELMLRARDSKAALRRWLSRGGLVTLESYGTSGQLDQVPELHFQFLRACLPWYETETHFFVHANYDPRFPLAEQNERALRRVSLRDFVPGPHRSGKTAVVGHTPQSDVLDLGHLVGLDTGCAYDGKLTAMDVTSGQVWQAEE